MTNSSMPDGDSKKGSGLARLGLGLTALCVLLLIAIVVATRTGAIGIRDAFGAIQWVVYGGGAVALVTLAGCLQAIRTKHPMAAAMAGIGLIVALLIVWVPYSNRAALRASPRLSDISTDTGNPPVFVDIANLRRAAKARNPMTYGPEKAKLQQAHYPDIKPVRLALPVDKAFERTLAAVNKLRWRVVATEEPGDKKSGRIEAFDTSLIFGFVDDVVIRVAADGTDSRIDIRSSSRIGRRDAGVNAKRVRKLIRAIGTP